MYGYVQLLNWKTQNSHIFWKIPEKLLIKYEKKMLAMKCILLALIKSKHNFKFCVSFTFVDVSKVRNLISNKFNYHNVNNVNKTYQKLL